ncbi:MAG: DUF3999 domain-containing protein [Betaproteobacteria bacterium]|jgi:hypothetical protein|nr:DUF3999 domain-containing protein [Betaproteobacteria bacterium]
MNRSAMLALVTTLVTTLVTAYPVGAAEPRMQDFGWTAPIAIDGRDALYVAEVPLEVYAGSARRDLADLRVYNGAGEIVPYALRSVATPDPRRRASVPVPIFPVWGKPGTEIGGVSVRVKQGRGGAIIDVQSDERGAAPRRIAAYLVDTSALDERVQALEFDWNETSDGFVARVHVESSDDLARWTFVGEGPLVALRHAGHVLAQQRVEVKRVKAKYLRVSWPAAQAIPQLTAIRAEPVDSPVATPRAWHTAEATPGEKPGEYLFDLGANAPFDRLRLELPNPNTIVPVAFLVRARQGDPWRPAASATVYRLTQGGQSFVSGDTVVRPTRERYWMVRADPRSGGLGAGMPKLTAGFVPQQILFVARGEGPFVLAFGSAKAASAALPVATLVPGYRDDRPLEAAHATLGAAQAQTRAPSAWPEWLELEPGDWKKLALWGVLVIGVALLAWMAWRLSTQMGKPASGDPGASGNGPD